MNLHFLWTDDKSIRSLCCIEFPTLNHVSGFASCKIQASQMVPGALPGATKGLMWVCSWLTNTKLRGFFLCSHHYQWNLPLCVMRPLPRIGELTPWIKEWNWGLKIPMEVFQVLNHLLNQGSRPQALFKSVPPRTGEGKTEARMTWQYTTASKKYLNVSSGPWWQSMFHRIIGWRRHLRECHLNPFFEGGENQVQRVL